MVEKDDGKKDDGKVFDKHTKLNSRIDSIMQSDVDFKMSIFAALLVLFSALIDPRISVALSLIAMISFAVYKFSERKKFRR